MALTFFLSRASTRHFPYSPAPYTSKVKCALVFDIVLITSLIAIGILAIIGSCTPSGHALHAIGIIGKAGGSIMIASGIVIGLVDALIHQSLAGFKPQERFPPLRETV